MSNAIYKSTAAMLTTDNPDLFSADNFWENDSVVTPYQVQKSQSPPDVDSRSSAAIAVQIASISVIILGSSTGNLLILLAIYKHKVLQNKTSIFLANLAIVDFFNGIITMPFVLVCTLTNYWPFTHDSCSFLGAFLSILATVSIGTLGSIAHDRYCAIVYPLRYHSRMSKTKIASFLAWIWIQAVAIAICPLFGWSEYIYIENEYVCTANWGMDISYALTIIIFYCSGPLTVMVYCYVRILIVARRHSRQIATLHLSISINDRQSKSSQNQKQSLSIFSGTAGRQFKKDAKSAFMVFIVIVTVVVCWLPHAVTMFFLVLGYDYIPDAVYTASTLLALSNSMFNPILYGLFNRQYRNAFKRILCSQCRNKHRRESDEIASDGTK